MAIKKPEPKRLPRKVREDATDEVGILTSTGDVVRAPDEQSGEIEALKAHNKHITGKLAEAHSRLSRLEHHNDRAAKLETAIRKHRDVAFKTGARQHDYALYKAL